MAQTTGYSTSGYAALLKQIVAKGALKVLPEAALLQKHFAPDKKNKVGQTFEQLVRLTNPGGFTYGGTTPTINTSLNYKAGVSERAILKAVELILQERIPYALLSRGGSSEKAVEEALSHFVEGVMVSMKTQLEILALHGQRGFATVSSAAADGADAVDVTLTAGSFAPAVLNLIENQPISILTSALTALTDSAATGLVASAINVEAGTLKLTGTGIGTAAAAIASTDKLCFTEALSSAAPTLEMQGLMQQTSRTTGTDFGINRATYQAWRGTSYAVSAALTAGVVVNAVAKAMSRGFVSGKMNLYVNPLKWAALNTEQIGKRSLDSSYRKAKVETGHGEVVISNGSVDVFCYAHPFMNSAEGLLVPADAVSWKTSLDEGLVTLLPPGAEQELVHIPGSNACEIQAYADCQIFNEAPAHSVVLTGIS